MKKIVSFLLILIFSIQVNAQEPEFKIYLPVITKMIVAPETNNNWRIIQPLASTNIVLNPSAETTGNFSSVSGATVTRSTTYQKYGLYSYRIQSLGAGDGIQLTTLTFTNAHHYITVRVRGTDFTQLQASISGNAKNLLLIEKIDSDWNLYGASFGASLVSGATAVQILDTASGGDFYIDGIQVEAQTVWTTYIDGTQEGCGWLGAAHAASSERSGQSRAGGISYDFWDKYKFQIQRISGAGASSHRLSIDDYAILPGGELNSDKTQTRDFDIVGKFITGTEEELHQKRQELEAAFQTDDNQLIRIRFNGAEAQKEIAVRYDGGLEADIAAFYGNIEIVSNEQYSEVDLFTEDTSIQVTAPNPYWLEVGESAIDLDTNASATFRTIAARLRSIGQWDELGPPNAAGTYTEIKTIAEDAIYIYFGGDFLNFDNIANADYIVRWNKQTQVYSALATGTNDVVRALIVGPDGKLYAGGEFTLADGVANTAFIASWDGSSWSALGTGTNNNVLGLAIGLDGTLYAGGEFTLAGGGGANRVAAWDGSSWSALGTGINSTVEDIVIGLDDILYVGGFFTTAGGSGANNIASWDGSSWSTLGSGTNNFVQSLVVSLDGTLYAGGGFTVAGGNAALRIAAWNGTSWRALGSGMDDAVDTVAIGPDNILYAGGDFTTAGGVDLTDRVARWNNFTWLHLDVNLPGTPTVDGLLVSKFADPVIEQNYDLFLGFNTTGAGTFAGAVVTDNEGSVQAFPKIIYARSGGTTAVLETLRNETTGKELLFNYPLLDGETLTIDLDPLAKSIVSSFFGSRLDAVLPNSDFGIWALQRGDNNITSYINESGTPTLVHYMLWRDAYSGYD